MPYLHHLLVHFPIALAAAAAVISIIALRGDERWTWLARLTTAAAAVLAIVTAATGLLSAGHVIEMGGDPALIARHRNFALGSTALMLIAAAGVWFGSRRRAPGATAALLAAMVTAVASHFGGEMLHPGLSPWSAEPHHHGPFSPSSHAPAPVPAPVASAPAAASAGRPVASATASAPAAKPPAHDHSGHQH